MNKLPRDNFFQLKTWPIIFAGFVLFSAKQVYDTEKIAEKIQAASLALVAVGLLVKEEEKNRDLNSNLEYQVMQVFVMTASYDQRYIASLPVSISSLPPIPQTQFFADSIPYPGGKSYDSMREEIAQHLATEDTQYQLKALAKEACNYVFGISNEERLGKANPSELESRSRFYNEVYLYLRVWLKNSLKYGVEMPLLDESVLTQAPFAEAIEFLRDNRSDYFLTDITPTFSSKSLAKVVQQYLDILHDKIKCITKPTTVKR